MQLISKPTLIADLANLQTVKMLGGLIKAVVDIQKKVMVVDAPMHADEEAYLRQNNYSRSVEDVSIQKKIIDIVNTLILK